MYMADGARLPDVAGDGFDFPLQHAGIFRNRPVFPGNLGGTTAIPAEFLAERDMQIK